MHHGSSRDSRDVNSMNSMNSMKANEISREDWMLRRISTREVLR